MTSRTLLMIPGPIELEPEVLRTLGSKTPSHVDPTFIETFGRAIERLREVFLAPTSQPFVVAGSGTLAMEMAVANVIERGDHAVVASSGFFGERMATIFERHGAVVTRVEASLGAAPRLDDIARAIGQGAKAVAVTHVDTSTGVRAPVEAIAKLAREGGALSIVDGVCSVGGEELRHDAWGIDITLTASQKALGAPPGLAVVVASERALEAHRTRKTPVGSLYLDINEWLPIHKAYEARQASYFATPPTNLIAALEVSLAQIVAEGVEARFARHARIGRAFRAAWRALELRSVTATDDVTAETLSALYFPDGVGPSLVPSIRDEGAIVAGGLHPAIRTKYFRVGHMGATRANELLATVGAVARGLKKAGYRCDPPVAVAAAERALE